MEEENQGTPEDRPNPLRVELVEETKTDHELEKITGVVEQVMDKYRETVKQPEGS